MPRLTKLYTRKGDSGTTALGSGKRLSKDELRVEAYGTVDELNAMIGVALAAGLAEPLQRELRIIQNELFNLGSDLSFPEEEKERVEIPLVEERHVRKLERIIDEITADLGPLENFILPGGSPGAAYLHLARTVCRRAERRAVSLAEQEPVGPFVLPYLNRLSDALFAMSRFENMAAGVEEPLWDSRA